MGQAYFVRHGMSPEDNQGTADGKGQKLYVGGQPCQYVGHHVDVGSEQKSFCVCGQEGTGKDSHFRVFLQKCLHHGGQRGHTQSNQGLPSGTTKVGPRPEYLYISRRGGVPEEESVLDGFKDGAFKMAIAHKIPVVPMTFHDNKKRFPFTLNHGGPGQVRAKVHRFFETGILSMEDTSTLREEVREVILKELLKP